jgi:hypothetical protein
MSRQALEVADIFRTQGQVWRQAHAGHISLDQLKVMSAIETCRSAALGGHVLRCSACEHQQIAYNSCRNRHCPRHLGARVGLTLVLHTWSSAMIHHPHVHGILPGGGLSMDSKQWIHCRPGFFLPVRVLSRLFRRLFLERLNQAYQAGALKFFGEHRLLANARRHCR